MADNLDSIADGAADLNGRTISQSINELTRAIRSLSPFPRRGEELEDLANYAEQFTGVPGAYNEHVMVYDSADGLERPLHEWLRERAKEMSLGYR